MAVPEHRIHQLFHASVLLKGFYAVLECLAGAALAILSTNTIVGWITWLTQDEYAENPNDFIATYLLQAAQSLSVSSKHFYVLYLLGHGTVKLLLVIGLLKREMWAYPVALGAVSLFIVYQVHRYTYTHSFGLILLTIFDLLFIALVWHEYQRARHHLPRHHRVEGRGSTAIFT